MWLLDTATAELHEFNSPEDVPSPGYAILSHAWGKEEQSFQEIKAIGERCKLSGKNPRDKVAWKIRRCCEIAEEEGYKWVWIDTCCIDKTSSAERSEAINSTFRFYALSAVCYVFLDDVEKASDLRSESRYDDHCRWATRGWTLQELIAPTVAILYSRSWTPIGSRHDLADRLEMITTIPASLLRHETRLSDYSVAQRMAWAARRKTTRIEDEAYCLLGIFDIHMSPMYGEGPRAFRRLQEEIMRTSFDPTLFAWGQPPVDLMVASQNNSAEFPLLARAPSDFEGCSDVVYSSGWNDPEAFMSFHMTPHGIRARVPLLVNQGKTFIDLRCTKGAKPVLLRVEHVITSGKYSVIGSKSGSRSRIYVNTSFLPMPPGEMTEIYFDDFVMPDPGSQANRFSTQFPCNVSPDAPFHFSFTRRAIQRSTGVKPQVTAQNVQESWKGSPPAVIRIRGDSGLDDPAVVCGICTAQSVPVGSLHGPSSHIHWARVVWLTRNSDSREESFSDEHDCTKDHIADWANWKRLFTGHYKLPTQYTIAWDVVLSFVKSKVDPNILILRSVTWYHQLVRDPDATVSTSVHDRSTSPSFPHPDALATTIADHAPSSPHHPSSVPTPVFSPNTSHDDFASDFAPLTLRSTAQSVTLFLVWAILSMAARRRR